MNQTTKKQHYIWRCYLAPWTRDNSNKGQIFCRREGRIFPVSLMNVAHENYFYEVKELSKREIELNVSGPFHSKFLKTAGEKMSVELEKINLTELEIPYVTNVTGEYVSDISKTKELLVKQISSPVKCEQSVRNMINNGVDTFVEIGPGKTLAGFIRKIDRNVKCFNISTVDDLDKLKEISL